MHVRAGLKPAPTYLLHMPFDKQDIAENKIVAAVGYLSVLCFVPLLAVKDSAYAQAHGHQGLAVAVFGIGVLVFDTLFGWFPIIGWFTAGALTLLWFVLSVIGVVKALSGEMWEVPVIGKYFENVNL